MRRIARLLTVAVAFALVQGCGTTNQNKAGVSNSGQTAPTVGIGIAPSSASSKGGTAARPGTVTVDLSRKGAAAQAAPTPVKKETAPAPAPAHKEVAKAEPKPAKVQKPAPARVEKPAPAPAPKKEIAKSTHTGAETELSISPYSSKGGSAARPGAVTVNLSQGTSVVQPPAKTPPPPKKEKPVPAPKPGADKPMAKVEPAKPGENESAVEAAAATHAVKLGMVSQVNNEYKFIVIEFDSEKPLPAGSMIQIVRDGKVVAKAKLEEPLDHWPLATATVLEGTPEKADSVSQ